MAQKEVSMSARFSLNDTDWKKIWTGCLVALAGAAIVILSEVIPGIDYGQYTPVVTALSAVLVNMLRKWVESR